MVDAYLRTAMRRRMPAEELEPYLAPWLDAAGKPALYRQIAQMDLHYTDEIEPWLGAVRCPLSLLWGEADDWIPLADGRALAERLRPGRFRVVPGSGHLMQEDAPAEILAEARDFLDAPIA